MKVYHQAGHNTIWNKDSFQSGVGDGIILSPVHISCDNVGKLDSGLKKTCVFDPQYYVPDSQKTKINTYDFFPEKLMDGFSTRDFEAIAHDSAQLCLDFQIENDFQFFVVPTRYHDQMVTDFIEKQKSFTVEPFLKEIKSRKVKRKVFLTLALTASMIQDKKYRIQLLNWVTSYPEITGVYLLVNFDEQAKQIQDFNKLYSYFSFVQELMGADLEVLCGYCNTEGLLLTTLDVFGTTIGAYENTRKFSVDKFFDDESEVRGPAPRVYFPKLLNWIRFDTIVEIKEDHEQIWEKIYTPTTHSESLFERGVRPHFTKPELYHHHFELIFSQYTELRKLKIDKRFELLINRIKEALQLYEEIESNGVAFFDSNCKGDHLPIWNRLLNKLSKG